MNRAEAYAQQLKRPVFDVRSEAFFPYGRVLSQPDPEELLSYMRELTPIPEEGNLYVASDTAMETLAAVKAIRDVFYGGLPVEAGYCNGMNTTMNGFEYHKGSELDLAVTDQLLFLGHATGISFPAMDEIRGLPGQNPTGITYDPADAVLFFVPAGTFIELYPYTLHLSPIRVNEEGFRTVVILPAGTNTPLSEEEKASRKRCFYKKTSG